MKERLLSLAIFLTLAFSATAQVNFNWAKQLGGVFAEKATSIKTDALGNVYTTGQFAGVCDFDPGAGTFTLNTAGNSDIFVSKIDASGNFLWAKKMGGTAADVAYGISVDASGNVYTVGYFTGTADFDPGAATVNLISLGSTDIFISKLDASGNFVWAKQMSGAGFELANAVTTDISGNIYLTGNFNQTVDFDPGPGTSTITTIGNDDIFVCKLNSSGSLLWVDRMGGTSGDFGNSINLDNSNNVLVCGYFTGSTDFDPGVGTTSLTSNGFEDVYICKLDVSGNFLWAKNMGSTTVDWGFGVAVDGSGNVYSTGSFRLTADFDPGPGTFNLISNGGDDIFVSKLDASGNFVWAKNIGGASLDVGNAISVDAAGNSFVTGAFRVTVDFNPGAGTYTLASSGNADTYVLKLDPSGNFSWAGQGGGTNNDYGYGITIGSSGSIHSTGSFLGTADFDPSITAYNLTSGTLEDVFILKLDQCAAPAAPTNITPIANQFICTGNTTTLNAAASATINWYSTPTGGLPLFTGSIFTTTVLSTGTYTFYVANTNTCSQSATRTNITVTVNPLPVITASTNINLLCSGQNATLTAVGASTYTWNPGGIGNSIVVNPVSTSVYTITGTDINGCQNLTNLTQSVTICTGIAKSNSGNNLTLFPDPALDNINIHLEELIEPALIEIFNSLGSRIYSAEMESNHVRINVSNYEKGLYFITVKTSNLKIIRKIIKE